MATVPNLAGFTVGERVTAAKLTGHTKTAVDFLINPPLCRMRHTVAQSIPTGTGYTAALLGSVESDNDGMADTANNRMVIQTPGKYLICVRIGYVSNATGLRAVYVTVNGSGTVEFGATSQAANGLATVLTSTWVVPLVASDNLSIRTLQNSGGALNTTSASLGAFTTAMSAQWIGT